MTGFLGSLALSFVAGILVELFLAATRREYQRLPFRIARIARRMLPAELRELVYEAEWSPELLAILTSAPGGPVRRYWEALKYAAALPFGVAEVARELGVPRRTLADWSQFRLRWVARTSVGQAAIGTVFFIAVYMTLPLTADRRVDWRFLRYTPFAIPAAVFAYAISVLTLPLWHPDWVLVCGVVGTTTLLGAWLVAQVTVRLVRRIRPGRAVVFLVGHSLLCQLAALPLGFATVDLTGTLAGGGVTAFIGGLGCAAYVGVTIGVAAVVRLPDVLEPWVGDLLDEPAKS